MIFAEKLDLFIDDYCKKNKYSGSLRVTHKDKIIYEKFMGYADIENQIPIDRDTVFSFYSLSKPFCAIGLLKLADACLVDIDDHPGKYVPEAKTFDERVTIRQCLNHLSGLPDFEQSEEFRKNHLTGSPEELRSQMTELARFPMLFEPGTAAMYANVNFIICALIIENVAGAKYADYMKNEIFTPLGMKTAQVDNKELMIEKRAKGYNLKDGELCFAGRSLEWMYGAGDIVGTVDDAYCLNMAIKEKRLLKNETWETVLTPSTINSMGLGCTVANWHGKHRITHNGGHIGFRTLHIQLPEDDFDIILLSNCGFGNARVDFQEAIYEAFYGRDDFKSDEVKMDTGYIP